MFSLPTIPNQAKRIGLSPQNRSFLRITGHPMSDSSLQDDALLGVHQRRYVYIDFQSRNSVIELEQQDENQYQSQDEVQQIGGNCIAGLSQLQKMCQPSFQMHRFVNEERNYIQKRKKWNRLLGKQPFRDSIIDFNSLRQKVNPERLEEFLEKKDIQAQWKKIIAREELLYAQQTPTAPSPREVKMGNRANRHKSRVKQDNRGQLSSKWKFKKLQALNLLLN